MEIIYALISNGVVQNIIVADANFIAGISANWQHCVRIDQLDPVPGIGWSYDGATFTPPQE